MSTEQAFQDLLGSANHCHGCGRENPHGLHIKSYWEGDQSAICRWRPKSHHCAGAETVVNGGIIASLIDCHSVNLAMAAAYRSEDREIGSTPHIWYVTGRLTVQYLKPTPIDQELIVRARIVSTEGRKTALECTVAAGELITATGEVLAIRSNRID